MFRGEKLRSGPISRVLSWATISLGRRLPAASSSRPEGDYGPNRPARPLARPHPLCLALLPVGFTLPFRSPGTRCALTAPFHPYRWTEAHRRYVFCGTVPVLADGGRYPPRRPAEPGLSSPRSLARRSPGPLRSTFIVSDAGEQRGYASRIRRRGCALILREGAVPRVIRGREARRVAHPRSGWVPEAQESSPCVFCRLR